MIGTSHIFIRRFIVELVGIVESITQPPAPPSCISKKDQKPCVHIYYSFLCQKRSISLLQNIKGIIFLYVHVILREINMFNFLRYGETLHLCVLTNDVLKTNFRRNGHFPWHVSTPSAVIIYDCYQEWL